MLIALHMMSRHGDVYCAGAVYMMGMVYRVEGAWDSVRCMDVCAD